MTESATRESTDQFWWSIEKSMRCVMPMYLKQILRARGYDNAESIGTLTPKDIQQIENYFKEKLDKDTVKNANKIYFHEFHNGSEQFEILPGHVKLLEKVVSHINTSDSEKKTLCSKAVHSVGEKLALDTESSRILLKETTFTTFTNHVVEEQTRISRTIRLWLKTHDVCKKFTENISPKMVEISVAVCCPVCEEKIELRRELIREKGGESEVYSIAEFKQHIDTHNSNASVGSSVHNSLTNYNSDGLKATGKSFEGDGTFLLNAFVSQAHKNALRSKPGYRFDPLIKMFACFIKMISGLLTYETLHANLPLCLPSTSTVDKFMKDSGPAIIEGVLRTEELLKYLKDRNLPMRVDLSEDATRITASVGFDVKTNQLVGFTPPMDKNGMPIPLSFDASTAKAIQDHFSTNNTSSSVMVVLAQPQSETVPPFCLQLFLSDNTHTADKVLSRWDFTKSELNRNGIKVDNISTDGDPRSLKVMKLKSQLGVTDLTFLDCEWFSCGRACDTTYTQDATHIGTKSRNFMLKVSRITPIGSKLVSITHLNYLIDHVSKDKHLLTPHDIQPKDRQNFHSVEKICAPIVLSCLEKYVPDSEGTAMFLKALNYTIYSYLDKSMTPADRVYKIWYAIFFFRVWRSWLIKWNYTLKESFISSNCYNCIELNGHTLVKQLLKTHSDTDYEFSPKRQGSQQCESMFRQVRSMSSTYSTVVNCSMLQIVHRIRKIQLQSDIMAACSDIIKFPRLEKKELNATASVMPFRPPSKDEIISWIEKAKADLTNDMKAFGIDAFKLKLDFKCQVKSPDFEKQFEYDEPGDVDDEFDDDEMQRDTTDDDNTDVEMDPEDEIRFEKDLHILNGVTGELSLPNYSHRGTEVDPKGPFAVVLNAKGEPEVVLKSTICWFLTKNKIKSSSDRMQRVAEKDYQPHIVKTNAQSTGLVENTEIHVGDWCVFKHNSKRMIGLILSFCYVDGTSLKERSFTKSFASVNSDKEIGVLGTWYSWNKAGVLKAIPMGKKKHEFLPIKSYKITVEAPTYIDNVLTIPKNVLNIEFI